MHISFTDTKGAAFDGVDARRQEIARVLGVIGAKVLGCQTEGILHDVNGNKIGEWWMDDEPEDE